MADIPTTLLLDHVFQASVDQTYEFTLLGEDVGALAADETITIDVPVSSMNKILTYSSGWFDPPGDVGQSGVQPLPTVVLRIAAVVGPKLDALTAGLTGSTGGVYPANALQDAVDGDNSSACNTLINYFRGGVGGKGFTYHAAGGDAAVQTTYLEDIPVEAIQKFEVSPINTDSLKVVVGNHNVIPEVGATGSFDKDAEPLKAAIQTLFEQAVDSGMVDKANYGADLKGDDWTGESGTPLGAFQGEAAAAADLPVYGVQFVPDQTLGFYVKYNLTKTRNFKLSGATGTEHSAGPTTVTFGDNTFDLDGEAEVSTAVPVTYQIVLRAVADVALD